MQGVTATPRTHWLGRLGALMARPLVQAAVEWKEPLLETGVAGLRHHQGERFCKQLNLDEELRLRREPQNPYDANAVSLWFQGRKIGYLPRTVNPTVARALDRGRRLEARVSGLSDPAQTCCYLRVRVEMICRC